MKMRDLIVESNLQSELDRILDKKDFISYDSLINKFDKNNSLNAKESSEWSSQFGEFVKWVIENKKKGTKMVWSKTVKGRDSRFWYAVIFAK